MKYISFDLHLYGTTQIGGIVSLPEKQWTTIRKFGKYERDHTQTVL